MFWPRAVKPTRPVHFGLAALDYTHSTAPNRRFADLVTQRIVKAMLAGQPSPYTDDELGAICTHLNERDSAARKVERAMQKRVAAVALGGQVGRQFTGVITGANDKGTFIRVFNPPVEGQDRPRLRRPRRRRHDHGNPRPDRSGPRLHRLHPSLNAYHHWMNTKTALLTVGLMLLTACNPAVKPTNANYIATLNAYYPDHPDCLLDGSIKFPFETGEPAEIRQMDALVAAQILEVRRASIIKRSIYTLTPEGARIGPRLCYGHREITSIDSSTPPALANGFTETQVAYTYRIEDMPVWAKDAQVLAVFPNLAHEASGAATGKATLALTRVGWSVPD